MAQQNAQKPASKAMVTGVVIFYLVAALAMVMVNKWVLNATDVPLFFLWIQLMIAVVMFVVSDLLRLFPDRLSFDLTVCKGLVPMVTLNVIGLSFSNYTLKRVDASFYQVARGLLLPFTVATSYIFLHARPSLLILLACSIVTVGFFIGVFLDGTTISMTGIFFGISSSAITAIHSVVIKRSLSVVNGSALALSWYTNFLSAAVLTPIPILTGEGPAIMKLFFDLDELVRSEGSINPLSTFIWGSIVTGVFGFLMSLASLLSIKVTSPITHMVSSAVRGVAASFLGVWLFSDIITIGRGSSITIILLGSVWYTWLKHKEILPQTSAPPQGTYERVQMDDLESGEVTTKDRKPE